MNSPAVPERGHMRAADADRERVAEILREAAAEGRLTLDELDERLTAAYAAKTYAELEPVTRDLPTADDVPAVPGPAKPAPSRAPLDSERYGGEPGLTAAVAILGGATRKGDWVVPRQFTAFAFMGGVEIDMRDARFSEPTVTIHAVTIMGGIEVTVPEDATVRVTGIGVMGGFDHSARHSGAKGGPTIIIDGLALMGGVDIKRRRPSQAPGATPIEEG